jgi:sigma-B regulation protein RsbQ
MPLARNNVTVLGSGRRTLLMAHGFGCDQNMWRYLTPHFQHDHRIVLFDYAGCGKSDVIHFDTGKYSTLDGYAQDLLDVCDALNLHDVHLITHSVSTMIGLIAALRAPDRFASMAMVCPSPSFLNLPPDYLGGFDRADLQELLTMMDQNYIGWAQYLSPVVMGTNNGAAFTAELSGSFCSTDPLIAKTFARATFLSDLRHLLPHARHPALILQSARDALAAPSVGQYVHANMPASQLHLVEAEGHCLHMTHPATVAALIRSFLAPLP